MRGFGGCLMLAASLVVVAGCGGGSEPLFASLLEESVAVADSAATDSAADADHMERVAGDGQRGTVGTLLPEPLDVRIIGPNGEARSGAHVLFEIVEGSGELLATCSYTNAQGQASTLLRLGDVPGPTVVQAWKADAPECSTLFIATATEPEPDVFPPAPIVDSIGREANWSETGRLNLGRMRHTAALLDDGRVLVAGGQGGPGTGPLGYLSSCEVYDPTSRSWAMTGSLNQARNAHSMILLGDGRVLVAGGKASHNGFLASCELYDPATGTWSVTGSMSQRREHLALTLLNDGRVLATGGQYNHDSPSLSCELYDPSTGTWTPAGSMARERAGHTATLLNDGRVLVAGGGWGSAPGIGSCEIYDHVSNRWSLAASLNQPRDAHTATLLPDGRVLVMGGVDTSWLSSCEIYDPTTDMWSYTDSLSSPRGFMTATLLESGRVLAAGGSPGYLATCELYDPATGTWSSAVSMDQGRAYHTAILLSDGAVLVAGGYYVDGSAEYFLTSCELFAKSIQ